MAECRGVDGRDGVLQVTWLQHPWVEHARGEIWEGDHRRAGSDDSQQRACAVWHPPKTHLSPFFRGRGIPRGIKSEVTRAGWDEFFTGLGRVGWVVADDVGHAGLARSVYLCSNVHFKRS